MHKNDKNVKLDWFTKAKSGKWNNGIFYFTNNITKTDRNNTKKQDDQFLSVNITWHGGSLIIHIHKYSKYRKQNTSISSVTSKDKAKQTMQGLNV